MKKSEVSSQENSKIGSGSKKQRACQVFLLNGQEFRCDVSKQANGTVLLKQIYSLLNIMECDYFGLYFKDLSDQKYWLEPNKSIKKQLKNGPWSFYFSVKFYPPDPAQLLEDITRYYMVLQIRDDIVGGRLPCSFVTHALLGSFVVQSELGDYDRSEMRGNYVQEFSLAPNQTTKLEERVMELHKTLRGQTPEEAEKNYLANAKKLSLYGVDLHMSQDSDGVNLMVGISWNGIHVYRDGTLINRFAWPRVIKLSYIRSKFYITIRPLDGEHQMSMIGFKMPNHRAAKTVWKAGVEHHAFFRLVRTETPRHSKLIRVGSRFRYSGRTQQETRQAVSNEELRPSPKVVRSNSRRLRSDGGEVSPAKKMLQPVKEESMEELPPPLPTKADRKTKTVEEMVVTTTETVEVQHSEEPRKSDEEVSASSDDEYSDALPSNMTEHQKNVHKMKINDKNSTEVEFLRSESPHRAHSQDSLDAIDARLSPRKSRRQFTTPELQKREISPKPFIETSETVTTETVTVVTYDEKNANSLPEEEFTAPKLLQAHDDVDDVEFASIVSTVSSDDAAVIERAEDFQEEDKPDSSIASSSSSSVGEHPPFVAKVQDDESSVTSSSSSSSSNRSSPVVKSTPFVVTSTQNSNHVTNPSDDPVQIATVETRTVRVQDILIPQEENEVHEVSLTSDGDDGVMVAQATGEGSSASSLSGDSAGEPASHVPSFQEPPTVKTEAVVVDSYVEEVPEGTTSPPMVQTELKTITYESTKAAAIEDAQPQLVSSQIISSETEHTVTTTEITKVVHGGISETRVEKQMVAVGGSDVDHSEAMAEMIRETQRNNPNVSITKVVVHEERSIVNTNGGTSE